MNSYSQRKLRSLRGRCACRILGTSSWEATSFVRIAVQVNCRICKDRTDCLATARTALLRGAAAPSLVAILEFNGVVAASSPHRALQDHDAI